MWDKSKVEEKISKLEEADDITIESFNFTINEKPEAYARERKGRGKHFYNPKSAIIERYRSIMLKQLGKKGKARIDEIYTDALKGLSDVYVRLYCEFYIPIPKNDSVIKAAKKEMKQILPAQRPDIDNYQKLLLDAMHDVIYEDDCRVILMEGQKFFSINPRIEIRAEIEIRKGV